MELTIGLIGSIASIIGFLLQAKELKDRFIHALYGFIVTVLASGFIYYKTTLTEMTKIEKQASNIIKLHNEDLASAGTRRGFILTSLAFLEKNKDVYPDTYQMAKELALNIDILQSKEGEMDSLTSKWKLNDVASAMKKLLEGIAGNEGI